MILHRWNLLFFMVCTGFLCSFNSEPDKEYEKRINTVSDNIFLSDDKVSYQDNTVN